ncbi:MAG: hypothetical protein ACR2OJ_04905, partial [Hyphomicrobiales bacterium]
MTEDAPFVVQPIDHEKQVLRWQPVAGSETHAFLEHVVPDGSRDVVLDAAVSILERGISPKDPAGQETGLVVGYVQSGKTMSFEAAA